MDKGIAITQRSTYVIFDVEFTEGGEAGIPDDKTNNPIAKCLVTALLSSLVIKSSHQGLIVKGEKLRHTLFDDHLLHLDAHDMAAAAEVLESE